MPLQRRLPKRGFRNVSKKRYVVVNLRDLGRFERGSIVDRTALVNAGLVKRERDGVKLLAQGAIDYPLVVKVNQCSKSARAGIEAAGGQVELV